MLQHYQVFHVKLRSVLTCMIHNLYINSIHIKQLYQLKCNCWYTRYKPSASEHTTKALFPPSSSETRFKLDLAAAAKIRRPTWKVPAIIIQNNRKRMYKGTHISMDLNWQYYWWHTHWYFVNRTERSNEIRRSNYYLQKASQAKHLCIDPERMCCNQLTLVVLS